ncbi:MAG: hypothetical protein OEX77_09175 [Candidatus Bathyarchaeota archaeon]|nr:hypothetical protein [Candidatus Bathyarchaeota archaeon]
MQQPIKVDIEKIYKIDKAGNLDVERSWTLNNQTHQDVDISELSFYVVEFVNTLANLKAFDSSGDLEFRQERRGSGTKMKAIPRIDKLSPLQKYKMTLLYQLPSYVYKLGDAWLFSDLISGMGRSGFEELISENMGIKLRVILPKLKKRFWQSIFHESSPLGRELTKEEKNPSVIDNVVLEWTSSLSSEYNYVVRLIYGIRTNTQLISILTVAITAIVTGLINYGFSLLKGG